MYYRLMLLEFMNFWSFLQAFIAMHHTHHIWTAFHQNTFSNVASCPVWSPESHHTCHTWTFWPIDYNWILNKLNPNILNIMLRPDDPTNPKFEQIKIIIFCPDNPTHQKYHHLPESYPLISPPKKGVPLSLGHEILGRLGIRVRDRWTDGRNWQQ